MLQMPELRIGNYFGLAFPYSEVNETGQVKEIGKKQISLSGKWLNQDALVPLKITRDILMESGFTIFDWVQHTSVFQCKYFKCTLDDDGVHLFCDNLKNLKPVHWVHELQNLYFDLTGEELPLTKNSLTVNTTELMD